MTINCAARYAPQRCSARDKDKGDIMSSMDKRITTNGRRFSGTALRLSSILLLSSAMPAALSAPLHAESAPNGPAPIIDNWSIPSELRDPTGGNIPAALERWRTLKASPNYSFGDYARFLVTYPGWPDEAAMKKAAENASDLDSFPPSMIIGYFDRHPPVTNVGRGKYALALGRAGDQRASEWAVKAWRGGPLAEADELALWDSFGGQFSAADNDTRMDALIASGATNAAYRQMPRVSDGRRAGFDAALAMRTKSPDAGSRAAYAGPDAMRDPAFIAERAKFMAGEGDVWGARTFLATRPPLAYPPANPEAWYEMLVFSAKKSDEAGRHDLVYGITSRLDDGLPAGTDVSTTSFSVRDDYTTLAWLGGRTAMLKLGRPQDAIGLFARYGDAAKSPQTKAKGYYWAARAAQASGDSGARMEYLRKAAAYPDQYYGMLALEDLGQPIPNFAALPRPKGDGNPSGRPLYLAAMTTENRAEQSTFVRAIGNGAKTEAEHRDAVAFSAMLGRPDLAVIAGRNARIEGFDTLIPWAFPTVDMPIGYDQSFTLSHAIMRQESQFDRTAVSHAGARGLMQLMPATANETARGIGLTYDRSALTENPQYNIQLGSTFINKMLNYYDGNYVLAIAAYNAGPGNVNKWIRRNGDPRLPGTDIVAWVEDIPILETRNYVQRVLENLVMYDALYPDKARRSSDRPLSGYLGR